MDWVKLLVCAVLLMGCASVKEHILYLHLEVEPIEGWPMLEEDQAWYRLDTLDTDPEDYRFKVTYKRRF